MAYNSYTYVILNKTDIVDNNGEELIDFSLLLNRSADTIRYTLDGTQGVIKYKTTPVDSDGNTLSYLDGKTTYTHQEILAEMIKSAWYVEEEE